MKHEKIKTVSEETEQELLSNIRDIRDYIMSQKKKKKLNKDYHETENAYISKKPDSDGGYKVIFKDSAQVRSAPKNDYDRADLFRNGMDGIDKLIERMKNRPPKKT